MVLLTVILMADQLPKFLDFLKIQQHSLTHHYVNWKLNILIAWQNVRDHGSGSGKYGIAASNRQQLNMYAL